MLKINKKLKNIFKYIWSPVLISIYNIATLLIFYIFKRLFMNHCTVWLYGCTHDMQKYRHWDMEYQQLRAKLLCIQVPINSTVNLRKSFKSLNAQMVLRTIFEINYIFIRSVLTSVLINNYLIKISNFINVFFRSKMS